MGKSGDQSTDEFLAIRFPHLKKSWLQKVNDRLATFKLENGGSVEAVIRWSKGHVQWMDWHLRDLIPEK